MTIEIMAATHPLLPRLLEENAQLDGDSGDCKKEKRSQGI